jgi:DNA polymerase-3 subunit delta
MGDDVARIPGVLATLEGTYGPGARIGADDLEPFVGGDAGGVPPWELTDAIDKGDIPGAIGAVQRMMAGGGRHPLAILATLQTHVGRLLALDGADVRGEKDAAALLGMTGSTFPARKALNATQKLGHDRVVQAIDLVATADLDLKGARELPETVVMELLVARLARLAR